jgi:hypothetical protein
MDKIIVRSIMLFVLALFSAGLVLAEEAKIEDLYVELILDSSNSMNEKLEGQTKLNIAKNVLNEVLDDLSPDTYLGLRIYGADKSKLEMKLGQTEEEARKYACTDSVLKLNFSKNNISQAKQMINNTEAAGYTPIAYSLELAGSDLSSVSGSKYIILASDGQETCGGDPVEVVKKLKKQGIDIRVHTIGFAVDEAARKELEAIAQAGDGKYYSADTADQLKASFKEVIKKIREIKGKEDELFAGKDVTPGSSFKDAPLIQSGEYKLSNLAIGENINHVVKISLRKSQILKISATFSDMVTELSGNGYEPDINLYFTIFDPNTGKVFSEEESYLKPFESHTFNYESSITKEGDYYLLFQAQKNHSGGIYNTAVAVSVGLNIAVEERLDMGRSTEVSGDFKTAYPLEPGTYEENWIFPEVDRDRYQIDLDEGATLSVKVFPEETFSVCLTIFNKNREEIFKDSSKNPGAVAKGEYTAKEKEKVYILIETADDKIQTGQYEMMIKIDKSKLETEPKI